MLIQITYDILIYAKKNNPGLVLDIAYDSELRRHSVTQYLPF